MWGASTASRARITKMNTTTPTHSRRILTRPPLIITVRSTAVKASAGSPLQHGMRLDSCAACTNQRFYLYAYMCVNVCYRLVCMCVCVRACTRNHRGGRSLCVLQRKRLTLSPCTSMYCTPALSCPAALPWSCVSKMSDRGHERERVCV